MTTVSDPIKLLALANPVEPGSLREVAAERADDLLAALRANQVATHPLRFSRRRWQVGSGARPVLIAVVVVVVALALVPIGGASLGSRAVDGLVSLWDTSPPDQPALDTAAADAGDIAGQYLTLASVNDGADKVDLYLANAPQSVIDQLQAKHPGTYVIVQNNAAHPLSELRKVENSLPLRKLQAEGIDIESAAPTPDGYLAVGVHGHNVQAAQSALDAIYGPGIIKVYGGAQPGSVTPNIGTVSVPNGSSHAKP
ncbi:MAG TPA: hypothetical protein VE984_12985 [Gaiellaceae bacterium]|nr:hypothetical protein [Gaiellaceae bacterium]